jgi:tetratricopeptide (TPR) repeat protein
MSRSRLFSFLTTVMVSTAIFPAWAGDGVLQGEAAQALQRAKGLLQQGHYQKAAGEFERASELSGGTCAECLLGVGRAYSGARQLDAALQVTRMGLALVSTPAERAKAYNQLGNLLVLKGDMDAAQEAFRKAGVEVASSNAP